MILTELFDKPYPYEVHTNKSEWGHFWNATAELDDGQTLEIMVDEITPGRIWSLVFSRDDEYGKTDGGDAVRVFATVVAATKEFLRTKKPFVVVFTSDKAENSGRAKLYKRLVKNATSVGYKDISNPEEWKYLPDRIQQDLEDEAESNSGEFFVLVRKD